MSEAGGDGMATVDAGEILILGVAAKLQGLFDDRSKVLLPADMGHFRIGYQGGRVYTIRVAGLWRHQAVGGEENRRGQICKFFLLILPCGAEITLQVSVFLKLGITVCRQHLPMGVDVDAFALGLLQEQLQIVEIVAGNDDEGAFFYGQGHGRGCRSTIGFGVGLVKKGHAFQVFLTHFHDDGKQLIHAPVLAHGEKRFGEEPIYLVVHVAQHHGVVGVGSHTADAEENEGLEAADILLGVPELIHVIVITSTTAGSAGRAARSQLCLFGLYPI